MHTTPQDNLKKEDSTLIVQTLFNEQRLFWSCALAFSITLFMIVLFNQQPGDTPSFAFAAPGFVAGLGIKYLGRLIEEKKKIIASSICGLTALFALSNNGSLLLVTIIPLVNIGLCAALSRRLLSREQEHAYFKYRAAQARR